MTTRTRTFTIQYIGLAAILATVAASLTLMPSVAQSRAAGDDAEDSRGSARGIISRLTMQMSPGSDTCLRGVALFHVGDTAFSIPFENPASDRLYDLVVSAQRSKQAVSVAYVSDVSANEWISACDAFQPDRKYFRVRASSVAAPGQSAPRARRTARR